MDTHLDNLHWDEQPQESPVLDLESPIHYIDSPDPLQSLVPAEYPHTQPLNIEDVLDTAYTQLKEGQFMEALRTMTPHSKIFNEEQVPWRARLCFFLNMTCAYQGIWNLEMCNSSCETVNTQINLLICNNDDVQEKIRLQLIQLILKMQHCAIYSQMGSHDKALQTAQHNLRGLKECLHNIISLMESFKDNGREEKVKGGFGVVTFKSKIRRYQEFLNSLILDLDEQVSAENHNKRPMFYNWNNPETNEKFIRQSYASKHILTKDEESRSLLGVQQDDDSWIKEFNIGAIMHMTPVSLEELSQPLSIYDQLSKKKLYQKVIYSSILHFTIATEMRFLDTHTSQLTVASVRSKAESDCRSKVFKESELHHLKAIEMMCKGISTKSAFLSHLINSYQKHYMQNLIAIKEEDSMVSEIRQARDRISLSKSKSKSRSRDKEVDREREKEEEYYRMSVGNILCETEEPLPTRLPQKQLKHLKSQEGRHTARSIETKKKKKPTTDKQKDSNDKNTITMRIKSPTILFCKSGSKETVGVGKRPSKLSMLKRAISKDCELKLVISSQTQIKFRVSPRSHK